MGKTTCCTFVHLSGEVKTWIHKIQRQASCLQQVLPTSPWSYNFFNWLTLSLGLCLKTSVAIWAIIVLSILLCTIFLKLCTPYLSKFCRNTTPNRKTLAQCFQMTAWDAYRMEQIKLNNKLWAVLAWGLLLLNLFCCWKVVKMVFTLTTCHQPLSPNVGWDKGQSKPKHIMINQWYFSEGFGSKVVRSKMESLLSNPHKIEPRKVSKGADSCIFAW